MSKALNERGQLDPNYGRIVCCTGMKGSGKSIMALLLFQSYPYDRIVIDVAGDDGPMANPKLGIHDLSGTVETLPRRFPEHLRRDREPITLRYAPDPGSATFLEDMDAVVGLAYAHGRCALLVHEMGDLAPSNRVPTHTRRLLRHNRHRKVTGIFCAPRPITMDPLVLMQADLVYVFEQPNPDDQARIAANIGWPPADFAADVNELPAHGYLRFDRTETKPGPGEEDFRLLSLPPLPADVVARVERFRGGQPEPDLSAETVVPGW